MQLKNEPGQFTKVPNTNIWLNKRAVSVNKITSKKVYWEIVNCKITPASSMHVWLDLFPFLNDIDWKKVYNLVYTVSKEPYLQTFQYKILHRTINCRYNLWKWNVSPNGTCQYCSEIDTIEHHFYYCVAAKQFWNEVLNWFESMINHTVVLSVCEVLFGVIENCYEDNEVFTTINLVILICKWYINSSRTI